MVGDGTRARERWNSPKPSPSRAVCTWLMLARVALVASMTMLVAAVTAAARCCSWRLMSVPPEVTRSR